jgi:hypothetical protein
MRSAHGVAENAKRQCNRRSKLCFVLQRCVRAEFSNQKTSNFQSKDLSFLILLNSSLLKESRSFVTTEIFCLRKTQVKSTSSRKIKQIQCLLKNSRSFKAMFFLRILQKTLVPPKDIDWNTWEPLFVHVISTVTKHIGPSSKMQYK